MSAFDALVFAGGGSRCFWQLGFLSVAREVLDEIESVAAVSAGAAMACAASAGRFEESVTLFKVSASNNRKNMYPSRAITRRGPVFPHASMYRDAIARGLEGGGMAAIRSGPPIHVLLARPPRFLRPSMAALTGLVVYKVEKALTEPLHPRAGKAVGFVAETIDARTCDSSDELAELILQSSCTPPFTPLMWREHKPVLDGGLVDNVPVGAVPDARKILVLLTRPYKRPLPRPDRVEYVAPSEPVAVSTWEYSDPVGLQKTYDLGRRDAERWLERAST